MVFSSHLSLLWIATALLLSSSSNIPLVQGLDAPYGYQSGNSIIDNNENSKEGRYNSYAGGMFIQDDIIVITGATYDPEAFGLNGVVGGGTDTTTTTDNTMEDGTAINSDCFVAFLELPGITQSPDVSVEYKERFGLSNVHEVCESVVAHPDNEKMYLMGTSPSDGLLSSIRQPGSVQADMYGTILDFKVGQETILRGGRLLRGAKGANYPVGQVLSQGTNGDKDALYVAYTLTENKGLNSWQSSLDAPDLNVGTESQPNYIEYRPIGRSGMSVEIQKLLPIDKDDGSTVTKLEKTLDVSWTQEYGSSDSLLDVFPTALIQPNNGGYLFFAGYTKGYGPAVGGPQVTGDSSYNGFVTKINAYNGSVEKTIRIASPQGADDFIQGLCYDGEANVYVTGYTKGGILGDGFEPIVMDASVPQGHSAFIQSIDVETMTTNWVRQIAVDVLDETNIYHGPDIMGMACAVVEKVIAEGQKEYPLVYMAGNIGPNGHFVSGSAKPGGKDIFIAQMDTLDGQIMYMNQIGSSMDDTLAPRNGLVVDKEGNAIILGNTRGSLQRQKTDEQGGYSDIFVMSIGKEDGKVKVPVDQSGGTSPPFVDVPPPPPPPPTAGPPPPPPPTQPTGPAPTQPTGPVSTPTMSPPVPSPTQLRPVPSPPLEQPMNPPPSSQQIPINSQNNPSGKSGNGGAAAIVIVLLVVLVIFSCFAYKRLMYSSIKLDDDTDPISDYLSAFDFGDVEIKHSATGGYHAIYTNPELAGDEVGPNAETGGGERYPYRSDPYVEEVRFDEPPGSNPGSEHRRKPYRDDVSSHGEDSSSVSSRSFSAQDVAIVQDSLFMDDYDTPHLGVNDKDGDLQSGGDGSGSDMMREGHASTYDGLLDAYNSTWDELNPHKLPESSMSSSGGTPKNGNVPTGKLLDNDAWGQEII